jgi:hypothetical protein
MVPAQNRIAFLSLLLPQARSPLHRKFGPAAKFF